MSLRVGYAFAIAVFSVSDVIGADFSLEGHRGKPGMQVISTVKGRASVLTGEMLWFPRPGVHVRLAEIRACELPQWAFDPTKRRPPHLVPVPCGALAKAWLNRAIGNATISCRTMRSTTSVEIAARCSVNGHDLGYEMLRVGWALVDRAVAHDPEYLAVEHYARSARYGLWGTYVLDPDEWRIRAVDRTLARRPAADESLLKTRRSEITPPFTDWRNRPRRTDQ